MHSTDFQSIRILDDQGNPIFCGTCSLISTHNLNQYCEVQIEAHTHSQKMDVAAHSRTFQDPGKMLSQAQDIQPETSIRLVLQIDILQILFLMLRRMETN